MRALMAATRELRRVGRTLRQLNMADSRSGGRNTPRDIGAADVRAIMAARRLREICGRGIGDTAWALLLEACAARLEGRLIPITGLGMAENMARRSAHRCARALLARGLLSSQVAEDNQRASLVGLSDEGAKRMHACLIGMAKLSPWPQ